VTNPAGDDRPRNERLWPAPWVWAGAAALSVSAGVILVPVSPAAGLPAVVVVAVVLAVALLRTSPRIQVDPTGLRAGRARLPWTAVVDVTQLDAAAMRIELGVGLNALAYLCIRGWVTSGVKVTLADPADPTPYWLVSSRRPVALAEALSRR
jgi:Protein of unknown function (DUF3093)